MGATTMNDDAKPTRKEQVRAKRAEMLELVSESAERDLHDERYDWLRSLSRRRWLVGATLAMPVCYGLTLFYDWPLVSLICLIAYGAAWFLLRRATRLIADLPEEFLDERQLTVRYRAYYHAFLGAAAVLSVLLLIVMANQLLAKAIGSAELSTSQLFDLIIAALFVVLPLPTAIFAWTEPEL